MNAVRTEIALYIHESAGKDLQSVDTRTSIQVQWQKLVSNLECIRERLSAMLNTFLRYVP